MIQTICMQGTSKHKIAYCLSFQPIMTNPTNPQDRPKSHILNGNEDSTSINNICDGNEIPSQPYLPSRQIFK